MYDSPTSDDITSNYDVMHSMMPIYVTGMEYFLRTTNHHQISNHHALCTVRYFICTLHTREYWQEQKCYMGRE